MKSKLPVKVLDAIQGLDSVRESIFDYLRLKEEAKTKRVAIEKAAQVKIEHIRAQRDVLLFYLDKSFEERRRNFEELFYRLDKASEKNTPESLKEMALILGSILELAKTSPFKDIATPEKFLDFLNDPTTTFEL